MIENALLATLNSALTAFIAYCTYRIGYERGHRIRDEDEQRAYAKPTPAAKISDGPKMAPPYWML